MDEQFELDRIHQIQFSKKPVPIAADLRPVYKIAELCLVLLLCSRGNSASLMKLHFFSWVLKSETLMRDLEYCVNNSLVFSKQFLRLDPTVNRALSFAVSEEIIVQNGATYRLSGKGTKFAEQIVESQDVMNHEREFFKSVGKRITEQYINNLLHD